MESEASRRQVEDLLADYIDRLNRGERLSAARIREAHPELAYELLDHLEAFLHLEDDPEPSGPLGTLGDYTLRRQIGRGGMGVVFEAWENSMDRPVALKVLPAGLAADDRAFQRFLREARTAGKLSHPNIVPVFFTGINEHTPFYAMEFVEGETLAALLVRLKDAKPEAETPFGKKDDARYFLSVAEVFAAVADGLQHAHSSRVIHRDIKPSNLILDRGSDPGGSFHGRLRILDFGLARLEGQESLTASGDLLGTPLYMSPEQARRRKVPIDHRTDIYSLGATLYEVLAGRPPFIGKDQGDTLSQIIERDPVEPSKLNHRIPRDLETIALKCLRKDPADRYGTAEALGQDLRRFVRGDPIEARPQGRGERLARRLRRHRGKIFLVAAFAALASSLAWFAHGEHQARRAATLERYKPAVLAVLRRIQAGQFSLRVVAGESGGILQFSDEPASPVSPGDLRRLAEAGGAERLRVDLEELERVAEAVDRPDGHHLLARAYRLLERTEEAKRETRRALQCDPGFVPAEVLAIELSGEPEDRQRAEIEALRAKYEKRPGWQRWWLEAYAAMKAGDGARAGASWGRLIALAESEGQPYVGSSIEAYLGSGVAHIQEGNFKLAIEDFCVARALAPGLEPALLLGKAYFLSAPTEAAMKAAAETFEGLYANAGSTEKAEAALWIAAVYGSIGGYEEGLAWTEWLGEEVPARERLRSHFLGRLGRRREAIEAGRQAIQRDPGDPIAWRLLAQALLDDVWSGTGPGREWKLLEAVCAARRALDLDPGSDPARSLLGVAGEELKNEALERLRRKSMTAKGMAGALIACTLALAAPRSGAGQEDALDKGFFDEVRTRPDLEDPAGILPWGASLTADSLEVVYCRSTLPGSPWNFRLFLAERADRSQPFSSERMCPEINSAPSGSVSPSISENGLELYYAELGPGADATGARIMLATREHRGECFGSPRSLDEINDHPLVRGLGGVHSPAISADGLEFYFTGGREAPSAVDLYVARRNSTEEPFGKDVRALNELNTPQFNEVWPRISSDGLTLFWSDYFAPYRDGRSNEIWTATRPDRDSPFGNVRNLGSPVNTSIWESAPFITRDWPAAGSEIWFIRGAHGALPWHFYVATWHLDCNQNRTDDTKEIASGAAGDCNGNGIPDSCDIASGTSLDTGGNGIPDECLTEDLGGLQRPGDANGDDAVDLSDAVWLLEHLFLGENPELPCGGGAASSPGAGALALLDSNGDGRIDLSDAVHDLQFLFLGGLPPVLGTGCARMPGCPETCKE